MSESLEDLRTELDEADRKIVEALAARHEVIARVADAKSSGALTERDELREHDVLAGVEKHAQALGLEATYVAALFHDIIDHSVSVQKERAEQPRSPEAAPPLRVGYQGGAGAYSQLAAQQHFAERRSDLECRGYRTFEEMAGAVQKGKIDVGMLPVENTTAGSINDAYDLLAATELAAVGEVVFRVEHCLVALEPIPLAQIRRIASHPQALAQCSEFLAGLTDCQIESYVDTAIAVAKVVRDADAAQAAIASREAARRHGLEVLKSGIANQVENYTRFLLVARDPVEVAADIPCKTSSVFATLHQKGALAICLNVLADHELNLTKLESRPRRDMPWEYLFYADFEGNLAEENTREAIDKLESCTSYLKVLGSYPSSLADTASATASVDSGTIPS